MFFTLARSANKNETRLWGVGEVSEGVNDLDTKLLFNPAV